MKKWKAIFIGALVACLALLAVAGASYASPWIALSKLEAALNTGNVQEIDRLVDWMTIRNKMIEKMALIALTASGVGSNDERVPEVVLGVQNVVDQLMTAESLKKAFDEAKGADNDLKIRGVYLSMGTYIFAIENKKTKGAISLRLKRLGPMSWQIDEIIFLDAKALQNGG